MRYRQLLLTAFIALLAAHTVVAAEEVTVDPSHTWDLSDMYPSIEAWDKAREEVAANFEKIEQRRGTLGKSANDLYQTLQLISDTERKAGRVLVYAGLNFDEDQRVTETLEHRQLASMLYSSLGESTAWVQPELIAVGREVIESYIADDERLAPFTFQLDDSLRNAAHTLGEEAEQTLSYFSQSFGAPSTTYELLANSDIPWPTITLANGEEVRVDSQGYSYARASENRADRKLVFDTFWGKWGEYRSATGMVLNSHIQTQVALAKARNYDSVLQRELDQDNLPPAVYHTLVAEVNKALPTLHRYFKLRERILGLEQMHYYDIYPPLVSLDKTFDYETSKAITLDAMGVLGADWVAMQKAGMEQRWTHVYPQQGKRSGAYQWGVYDVHPYLLLNHSDNYDGLTTLAHEWGHAIHTLYAKQAQPYETSDYAIFIAEIPSTSLELILQDYMAQHAESIDEQLFYLGEGLEGMRGTFFRQTMFAEFELALYEAAERGEALSGEGISKIYGEIQRRYHGHDDGVVVVDDLYNNEWMFINHFYRNMYVFQYATSQIAGTALYDKITNEGAAGVENYKNLLKAGGSDYPYALLVAAGVDLTKPEPYQAMVRKMNAIMDEMERLLDQKESQGQGVSPQSAH
ncbi:MAG: oligoendopeptidase F [Proteobacteria bacterium]|nr:oligoendopeptidase F [Pseudomonadota bacterium]